jgi:hypothetical protein
MSYKLFLDDLREPIMCAKMLPHLADLYNDSEWVIARNYHEFCNIIKERWEKYNEAPTLISFDHDLGFEHTRYYFENGGHENPPNPDDANFIEKTGKDCANWLICFCEDEKVPLPEYIVHSANPVGSLNISSLLAQFKKHIENGG